MQETFEFAFNAACAFIATGDYAKAENLINIAKSTPPPFIYFISFYSKIVKSHFVSSIEFTN